MDENDAPWGERHEDRRDRRARQSAEILAGSDTRTVARHLAQAAGRNAENLFSRAQRANGADRTARRPLMTGSARLLLWPSDTV